MENMDGIKFLNFYKDKKILVTGHTGFKGSWLTTWLHQLGAEVVGISLDPKTGKDNFVLCQLNKKTKDYRADIRDLKSITKIIEKERPEILFHLAAQPIVIDSYSDPVSNFDINIMGTVNLLEAFRNSSSLKTGVFVTSDKCYDNIEKNYSYKESDSMGGHDPYSASKGAAELVISSYRKSFFSAGDKRIASVRAGNVIGGGDWSPFRLIVDVINGIENKETIEIRNPKAQRPWQHVLEPLGGYLKLAAYMSDSVSFDEGWNFGPESSNVVSVEEILNETIKAYGEGSWLDVSKNEKLHEAQLLSLNINKAKDKLNWKPLLDLKQTVFYTVDWYKRYKHENVFNICVQQINNYTKLIKNNE
tara:strand:- start:3389 stop:4471 length:1083 start_codon:yes stop_codon:yes gene_type:complete